jgi:hypothetical protein
MVGVAIFEKERKKPSIPNSRKTQQIHQTRLKYNKRQYIIKKIPRKSGRKKIRP